MLAICQKALINSGDKKRASEGEIHVVSSIVSSLQPIQLQIEKLSRRDANLLPARRDFLIHQLSAMETSFSVEWINSLTHSIYSAPQKYKSHRLSYVFELL